MYKTCQNPETKMPLISEAIGIMIEARLKMMSMVNIEDVKGFEQCLDFFETEIKKRIFEHNEKLNQQHNVWYPFNDL